MPRKHSAIRFQVGVRVDKRANVTQQFLTSVIREWADTGETPEGIEIVTIRWKHPNKQWKSDDAESVREKLGRLLRGLQFSIQHIR